MDDHAMHNVWTPTIPNTKPSTLFSLASTHISSLLFVYYVDLEAPSHGCSVTSSLPSTSTLVEKVRMKVDYLQNQLWSIELMASTMEVDLE